MDFLTNSLVGLALARAGLAKKVPRGTLLLCLAINFPDIDNIARFRGKLAYLEQHSGYTHSLLTLPFAAALCVLLTSFLFRERLPWLRAWLLACFGVGCHLLQDLTTTWGIRTFLPFSSRWNHWDFSGTLDPYVLTILALAAIWPHFSNLVGGEMGARGTRGRVSAIVGLTAVVLFEAARAFLHQQAVSQMAARLFDGAVPLQVAAMPEPTNPLKWTGIVETEDGFRVLPVSSLDSFDSESGQTFFKRPETPDIQRAKSTEAFRYFLYFARYPVWTVEPVLLAKGAGKRVQLTDLRFGRPADDALASFALENADGQLLRSWFTFASADSTPP